jgi:hypothetical protein
MESVNATEVLQIAQKALDRRAFVRGVGLAGLGAAAVGLAGCGSVSMMAQSSTVDSAQQVFTAALIAEGLATTFYYNGLVAPGIIQDPTLAGPGGTATNVGPNGQADSVGYLRAALSEEMQHADLLRTLIGGASAAGLGFDGTAFSYATTISNASSVILPTTGNPPS